MTGRSTSLTLLCLLFAIVGVTMPKSFVSWYEPTPNMKRIFNSPPSKIYGQLPTNKTLISPIWVAQGSNLYDYQNIDYTKPRVKFDFPCNLNPYYVLNGKVVLTGDASYSCPCISPGSVACPPKVTLKVGNITHEGLRNGETWVDSGPNTVAITAQKMSSDIIDGRLVIYKNDLPANWNSSNIGTAIPEQLFNGCGPATNAHELNGNIALMYSASSGSAVVNCDNTVQLKYAKAAGARAVVFIKRTLGEGLTGAFVTEAVLPAVTFPLLADIKLQITNSTAAGVPVTITFGPRIGPLTPQLDAIGNLVPPGLCMVSLQDFAVVSQNNQFFSFLPSSSLVVDNKFIYLKAAPDSNQLYLTYLNVSGEFNEKVDLIQSFNISAKNLTVTRVQDAFSRNGRNYLLCSNSSKVMIWDITNEASCREVWSFVVNGSLDFSYTVPQAGRQYLFIFSSFPRSNPPQVPIMYIYDVSDPTNTLFQSMVRDPSLWFTTDENDSPAASSYQQIDYYNGYLILLTEREGVQVWDVSDMSKPRLHTTLMKYTQKAHNDIGYWGGYDITFLHYKNSTLICHGHNNNYYAYSQAACWAFGSTSPFKRIVKTSPFPASALKTRSILDSSPSIPPTPTPTNVQGNDSVIPDQIPVKTATGTYHACALFQSGSVRCWGKAAIENLVGKGMLGYGTQLDVSIPTIQFVPFEQEAVSHKVIDLSVGNAHSCVVLFKPKVTSILKAYSIYCWGPGRLGRLGYGDEGDVGYPDTPLTKGPLTFYDAAPLRVFCGTYHTCAILKNVSSNNTVARCWGDSSLGQLGYKVRPIIYDAATSEDIAIGGEPISLALGSFHTCALITDGRVKCWGTGKAGQTGRDETNNIFYDVNDPSTLPFVETPNNTKVRDICAGSIHTCALLEGDQVYCMGSNNRGQVGQPKESKDGIEQFMKLTRVKLPYTNDTIARLSCGFTSTCVTFTSGAYLCWGDNTNNVLGFDTGTDSYVNNPASLQPTRFNSISVDWLSTGGTRTCAVVTVNGQKKIRCWGQDFLDNSVTNITQATDIWPVSLNNNHIQQIAASYMTCVMLPPSTPTSSNVKCWGNGNGYQLGYFAYRADQVMDDRGVLSPASDSPTVTTQYLPVLAKKIYVTMWGACALLVNGKVSCWGYIGIIPWAQGQTITDWLNNIITSGNRVVKDIVLARSPVGTCLIFEDGDPYCFTSVDWRGDRTSTNVTVNNLPGKIVQLAIGELFHCALNEAGQVACFGLNVAGQLALGDSSNDWVKMSKTDLALLPPGRVKKLAAGLNHACALYQSGDVACWGSSAFGQTGYGSIEDMGDDEPVEGFVDIGPYPAIDLSCGDSHTCVVVQGPEKRHAVCWGSNEYGQLGYPHIKGNVGDEESPAEAGFVDIPDDIASIVLGTDHTCILTAHGTIKCWGHGADGRLGYTGQNDIRDPSSVSDMSMTCGDGIKQYNEMCDDGNFIDGDGCSKFCKIEESWTCRSTSGTFSLCALCGDYLASLDETCDDGNTNSGDGCSSLCEIETGWECAIRGTVCNPIRGDGLIVGRETCDSGNVTGAVGCSSDSQILPGFYCKSQPSVCYSVCGDGKKSSQEACDDGNIDSGDGCSSGCNIESGWTCYVSCDQYLTCKSECSSNNSDSKVGLIVGLCVGLSLCVILLLILLFFFMGKKRQILIKESDLTLIRKIGEGDFGEVYEAKWKSTTVAVKQRKIDGISEEEIKMFSKEARVMQALPPHPNLVQFLGLCSTSDKLIIVCEYVEKGSVKRFLQEDCGKNTVTKRNQLELCLGICAGMDHLHSNGITHRDLACRNVLVEVKRSGNGSSLVSKISDFGLSVATSKQTRLPVRWTAPEVLKNPRSRNKEADVWSFGVTMYEVFTRCSELPYLGKKNQEVVAFVLGGGHLKEPPQVDGTIRDLMMDCFKFKPEWRPNFITLSARFEDIIKDMTNPTMTSNDTFSTIDTVETTSLQMFSDDDENDYMSMAKSEYSTSALTSSNVKKGNTYEVVKSTDYESLAK